MKTIFVVQITAALILCSGQASAITACPIIVGDFKTCHVESSPDPSVEEKYKNVKISVQSDNSFSVEMTVDDEVLQAHGVADGVPQKSAEGEITPLCTPTEFRLEMLTNFEGHELQSSYRFRSEKSKLYIELFIFDDIWQTTVCE